MDKGIHLNIPEDEYHKIKAIGSSPLKRFHDCPATCFDPIEQSESMLLGSAQDYYSLMGEDYFLSRFVVKPDFGDQRKAENKQKSEEFEKSIKDKLILPTYVTTKRIPTMKAIVEVDRFLKKEHPMSRLVMKDGLQQASLFWKDEESGLDCKGRLDHYPDKQNVIVDLKFCSQIDRFHNQIWDLRYFIQAGHYTNGAIDNDLKVDAFYFIAFCFGSPPSIRVCSLSQGELEFGKDVAKNTLRLIKECQKAKKWPEHNIPIETVSLAKILGIKSDIHNQLEPYDLIEEITLPRRKW